MNRLQSIDFVRGLVMVIMALDHVRDLMHAPALTQSPTDLNTTTPVLFMTRWITHLCAPTFVFLSGTSAFLSAHRSADRAASRRFLLKRGAWLILLELTIVNFGIWFDINWQTLLWQVIATIGAGLMVIGLVMSLPTRWVGLLGLLIVFGHNLLQGLAVGEGAGRMLWPLLFQPGVFPVSPRLTIALLYPVVPWLGIMLTGYAFGSIFTQSVPRRKRMLAVAGGLALVLFVVIREINVYGDPVPWQPQRNGVFTVLSFINTTKYPPSLLYTLMTLGISLLLLAASDGVDNRLTRVISVYGQVPLFYYLIHWYLIHSLMLLLVVYVQGFHWAELPFGPFQFGRPPTGSGVSLPVVYIIWLSVVAALYPLCLWYSRYKLANRANWALRYL